jgi:hypothetical protein
MALRRCRDFGDAHVSEAIPERTAVDLVPISDQIPWRRVGGECFQDLLSGPIRRRVLSHVEMDHPASAMGQDH